MATKDIALSRLRRQLAALVELPGGGNHDNEAFLRWFRATRIAVEKTFTDDSKQAHEFTAINFYPPIATEKTTDADRKWWHESGVRKSKQLLESFIDEIDEYWEDASGYGTADGKQGVRFEVTHVRVFISHRSTDKDLGKAMADLLRNATGLLHAEIRCTSGDGYRLPGGADTAAQLRDEVLNAGAMIGLITPSSISSAYVLFELGARWGADKHLCPVLARGANEKSLGGPLGGKNALNLTSRAEVIQMIEEVAAILDRPVKSWVSVQHEIDEVVRLASDIVYSRQTRDPSPRDEPAIDDMELSILGLLASKPNSRPTAVEIGQELQLNIEKARYHVGRLEAGDLIDYVENWGTQVRHYFLSQSGRALLVKRGIL